MEVKFEGKKLNRNNNWELLFKEEMNKEEGELYTYDQLIENIAEERARIIRENK